MNDATGLSSLPVQEQQLITAAARGGEANFRTHADQQLRSIRAATLRDLCTGANPRWKVQDSILVTGALVKGHLDLSGARLAHGIRFRDCVFEDPIDLRKARTGSSLEWEGGQTAAILADQLESDADLTIQGVEVAGTVSLRGATVRAGLRFSGSHLVRPEGRVIDGSDLRVGGTLFLDGGFHAEGEVRLGAARIDGELNCRSASFSNPAGYSISADRIVVGGDVLLDEGFSADGEVGLQWAKVGPLRATGGSFASATTYALHADALHADGGVYLDRGFHATATVRLVGANITGELVCTYGSFDNPDSRALDAERIVAEDVYLDDGFTARGEVRFNDATVNRQFNATNGEFRNNRSGVYALSCNGLRCGGDVFFNEGFSAEGTVALTAAEIGSQLNCTAGSFTAPGGFALFADGMTTPGFVYLDYGFRATGEVRFARATIGRQLVCTHGVFNNQHGTALDLTGLVTPGDVLADGDFRATGEVRMRNADITGDLNFRGAQLHGAEGLSARGIKVGGHLIWKLDQPPEGLVNLSFAQVGWLDDTAESWPDYSYALTGFTYRMDLGYLMTQQRLRWLRNTKDYYEDAYKQLAQTYRLYGRYEAARRISISQPSVTSARGQTLPGDNGYGTSSSTSRSGTDTGCTGPLLYWRHWR